jgi:hypothetical protein
VVPLTRTILDLHNTRASLHPDNPAATANQQRQAFIQWQLLSISINAKNGQAIIHRDASRSMTECSTPRYVEEDAYPRISEGDRRLQSTLRLSWLRLMESTVD